MNVVLKHILIFILMVLFVPNFACANLMEHDLNNSNVKYVFKDLPLVNSCDPKTDAELSKSNSENAMEQLAPLNEHSNAESIDFDLPNNITTTAVKALEVKDCAYYIDNLEHITATGYSANTLYFYGYENEDLKDKDGVYEYNWADTKVMGGSPFMEADVSKKIVFDESAKNIKPQSCSCWFLRFYTCEEIVGLENLDTSSVLDMSNMFAFFASDLKVVPALDLNNWNTSNVKNMTKMFYRFAMNSALTPELNISNWNTSSVSNMSLMFYEFAKNTKAQLTLDVSKWDTGMVEDMSDMFSGFASNSTLPPILDVSDWDTSNVKNMSEMFCHFSYLSKEPPKLNVSNWDTSNVSNMSGMFNGFSYFSSEPATIYASKKFCVDNVTDSFNMFFSSNIQGGAGTAYNSNHANIDGACIDILDGEWGSSKGYFTGDTAAVEFYANGAEGALPVTAMYALNSEFVLPDKGELTHPDGLNFAGWAIGGVSGEIKQPGDIITINKYTSIYAIWENEVYSVVLYTNGGTIAEGCDVSSYVYGVGAILPKKGEISKAGYIFDGWFDSVELSGDPVELISETDTGNKQYWAKWTAITYKITFNGNAPAGTSVVDVPGSVDVTYGAGLPALSAVPKCEGYKFNGFYYRQAEIEKQYYQADGNPVEGIIWDIASDVELLAYWSPIDNKTNSSECLHDSENTVETGDCSIILLVLVMIFSIFALTTVTVAIVYLLLFCSRNSHIS